jgi:GGDEF domain-containing protein
MEFLLTVTPNPRGGEPQWELSQNVDGKTTPLWTYVSCDVLLIHNLIVTSSGEAHKSVACEGAVRATDGYKLVYKLPGAYYNATIDLSGKEAEKQPKQNRADAFSGDLSLMHISNVFNSLAIARSTGRLVVTTSDGQAEVFFEDGAPIHAKGSEANGDECIMVMCTWDQGKFTFEPGVKSDRRTIRDTMEKLLLKGVLLMDKQNFLKNAGFSPDAILVRNRNDLAEAEFEQVSNAMASGSFLSYDMTFQKQFYLSIDNKTAARELVQKMGLLRSQWVPLLVRMLKCQFVSFQQPAIDKDQAPAIEPKLIDRNAIHSVMTVLRRPETGMYTYPAFLYFLEQEYLKHHRSGAPMSVAVIEMRMNSDSMGGTHLPLSPNILGEVVRRICKVKRDIDFLAHYEMFDFALILPSTNHDGGFRFAERMLAEILNTPLDRDFDNNSLSIAIGLSCVPDDTKDLRYLLAQCEAARNFAQQLNRPVVGYWQMPNAQNAKVAT